MKAEQAKKMSEEALERLSAALETGQSESMTAYLGAMAKFHHYSFGNILLIMSQKPEASRVAGFRTWLQFGRHVRRGEKGIVIMAPVTRRKAEDEAEGKEGRRLAGFRAVHVFDVSQTDGEPLPEPTEVSGNPNGHTERLKGLIEHRGIELAYLDSLGGADGRSHGGRIEVCRDLEPAEEFSVLVHELAHEMLHHVKGEAKLTKTVVETEAEAVAFVVCQAIGLQTGTASSDYIQLYRGDTATLADSLGRIQHTATEILQTLMKEA